VTATLQRRLQPSGSDRSFGALVAQTGAQVRALVDRLAAGDLHTFAWQEAMLETLAAAHAQAGYRGRVRAGDTAPFDRDDERFGYLAAQEESAYLWSFRQDIENGRYGVEEPNTDAIHRRAALYVARIAGTANEALVLTAGDEEVWTWRTDPGENCPDCLRLEAHSPYRGTPPTTPRRGDTACLGHCHCRLQSSRGVETFAP